MKTIKNYLLIRLKKGLVIKVSLAAIMVSGLLIINSTDSFAATSAESLVAKKASIISKMHKKAKKALVNSAQDKIFATYFNASDNATKQQSKTSIESLTLNVQSKFHVAEMCLIAADGIELTRIVGNEIAPDSDLSPDETGAIFFAPGFAKKQKEVLVSPTYMSPDALAWVISYVTPIVIDGKTTSILHYEHGLNVYQAALNKGVSGNDAYILAVTDEGYVVSDSRSKIAIEAIGEKEDQADYFNTLDSALKDVFDSASESKKGSSSITEGGITYDVAYAKLEGGITLLAVTKQ